MSIIFRQGSNPASVDSLIVKVDSKADQIREQGIEQLQGMQDVLSAKINESNLVSSALKQKADIEDKYRREAFKADQESNKYYNNAVLQD